MFSPLFSTFLNDLHDYFSNSNYSVCGVKIPIEELLDDLHTFLNLCILLYADDTVILSDDEQYFQNELDFYGYYCDILEINN